MDIVCPVAHERFSVADVNILEYRLDSCPLVPVPPHGRLIDASVLMEDCMKEDTFLAEMFFRKLSNAPTIIPASEEVKES